jgi:SAM-dependent methyltransferase
VSESWEESSRAFFEGRAEAIVARPTVADLCFVSGRDPRLWSDQTLLDDLAGSVMAQTHSTAGSSMLEVGCAAGFIANIMAPRVASYVGVDVSAEAVRAAKLLQLRNAEFIHTPGDALPFPDAKFDTAICYDVVTNFPSFGDIRPIVAEMLRVVKPGGRVMIGSVPDAATQADLERRVVDVGKDLDARIGPVPPPPVPGEPGFFAALAKRLKRTEPGPVGQIVCYYFDRASFDELGRDLGAAVALVDIHSRNPYAGFRFNAVYTKPA